MAERCGRRLGELEPWIRGQYAGKSMVFLIWFWYPKTWKCTVNGFCLLFCFIVFTWCFEFLHDFNSPKISKFSGTAVLNLIGLLLATSLLSARAARGMGGRGHVSSASHPLCFLNSMFQFRSNWERTWKKRPHSRPSPSLFLDRGHDLFP
jgi:hypothetical protein